MSEREVTIREDIQMSVGDYTDRKSIHVANQGDRVIVVSEDPSLGIMTVRQKDSNETFYVWMHQVTE